MGRARGAAQRQRAVPVSRASDPAPGPVWGVRPGGVCRGGALDGTGGAILVQVPGERPRRYSVLRTGGGGSVIVAAWGDRNEVYRDGHCLCGPAPCIHRTIVAQLDGWDPFGPREPTRQRAFFADLAAANDALADLRRRQPQPPDPRAGDPARAVAERIARRDPPDYLPAALLARSHDRLRQAHLPAALAQDVTRIATALDTALAAPDPPAAARLLALWHEVLRRAGVDDPRLPAAIGRCRRCHRPLDLSGACPVCLAATIDRAGDQPIAGVPPSTVPYLEPALEAIGGRLNADAVPALRVVAADLAAAAARPDLDYRAAAAAWNYFLGPLGVAGALLPETPATCRAGHLIGDDDFCGRCPADGQPSPELQRARRWLQHADLPGITAADLGDVSLRGDERGSTALTVEIAGIALPYRYSFADRRWQIADAAALTDLLQRIEATPDDEPRIAATLEWLAGGITRDLRPFGDEPVADGA